MRHSDGVIEVMPEVTTDKKCPKCAGDMLVKCGRFGQFLACAKYPECKGTRPISIGDGVSIKCPVKECDYHRDPELDDEDARNVDVLTVSFAKLPKLAQPTRNASPPMGVMAPSARTPLQACAPALQHGWIGIVHRRCLIGFGILVRAL